MQIASNMENTDTLTNTARLLRAGENADAAMDGRLRAMGYTTPVSLADAADANILQQISVSLVVAQLCRWRLLQTQDAVGNAIAVITKLGDNNLNWAHNQLLDINQGVTQLAATRVKTGPQGNEGALDTRGLPVYPQLPPGWGGLFPGFIPVC